MNNKIRIDIVFIVFLFAKGLDDSCFVAWFERDNMGKQEQQDGSNQDRSGNPLPEKSAWDNFAQSLKEAKEVITAISAVVAAIFFAVNYFASQSELNCLKAESSRNNELVNTILRISELSAIWQLESTTLERINIERTKLIKEGKEISDDDTKKLFQAKSNVDNREAELAAARQRKSELEANNVKCN